MTELNLLRLKRHALKLALVAVVLAAAIFVYWNELWLSLGASNFVASNTLLFHPDEIQSLDWQVEGQTFRLSRDVKGGDWKEPTNVDTARVQAMLVAVAQANPDDETFAPFTRLRSTLQTFDGKTYRFTWNGAVFKWTEGDREGDGGKPFLLLKQSLQEGRFVFEPTKWQWCKARPTEMKATGAIGSFTVTASPDGGWLKTENSLPAKKIDPTSVEKWLGKNCEITGTHWHDDSISRALSTDSRFAVTFADGSSEEWKVSNETGAVKLEGKSLLSPTLVSSLKELGSIP